MTLPNDVARCAGKEEPECEECERRTDRSTFPLQWWMEAPQESPCQKRIPFHLGSSGGTAESLSKGNPARTTKTPVASVVQQAFNVAVFRGLYFIPTEPRVAGPVTAGYKQWLAAGPRP
jgi:hypothetical protein